MQTLFPKLKISFQLKILFLSLFSFVILSCNEKNYTNLEPQKTYTMSDNKDWKNKLTPEEYHVLREKGTERAFTGKYNDFFEKGYYVCSGCGNKLFHSNAKFNSHCGWPSFDQSIEGSVKYIKDTTHGMVRTEVVCSTCEGHLGHVFDDGPQETTGQRYCMNSISLKFVPAEK